MDKQQRINKLKAELDQLEGKPAPAPAQIDPEKEAEVASQRLWQETLRQRQEIEDLEKRVCSQCFYLQPIGNVKCDLCGSTAGWLVPSAARADSEISMFMRMAEELGIERLKTALRSGWTSWGPNPARRQKVAERLLAARESERQRDAEAEAPVRTHTPQDEDRPLAWLDRIDIPKLTVYYDRKIAALDAELAQLRRL